MPTLSPARPHALTPYALPAALLVGLLVRILLERTNAGITMDSPLYVRMAEGLGHTVRLGETPAHHGYPLLIALASAIVPGRLDPGRWVALLASLGTIALTHAVARRTLGPMSAFLAALAMALHPLAVVYGGVVMTEAPFLAVVWLGLWLVGGRRAFAGGLALGLSYWIRPEAAVIVPATALLMRARPRARLFVLAGAVLALLPYLVLLRAETGHWSLSPKSALVRPAFASERDAEWHTGGASAIPAHAAPGLLSRLRETAPTWAHSYSPTLAKHVRRLLEAWPLPLLALSLLGLARRDAWDERLAPLACLLVIPLLTAPPDLRFAHLYLPTLVILAAAGGARLLAWRVPGRDALAPLALALLALLVLAGGVLLARGPAMTLALHFDDGPMTTLAGAGERLKREGRANALVMDRKAYVPFYAGMRHIQLPDDDLDTILAYAKAQGVDYLVVEEYVAMTLRPQLKPLLDARALAHEHRVRLLFALHPAADEGVAVFELARP